MADSFARALRGAGAWSSLSVLCLIFGISCSWGLTRNTERHSTNSCPPGTYDFGTGIVAALLPSSATAALSQAHSRALKRAGERHLSFLAAQPWRPHISLIYGVGEDRAVPAYKILQNFVADGAGIRACFGRVRYWDDEVGNKTTVVVDVEEPAGLLTALHDRLAQATQVDSRFAYHAHVTLAYLQAGARFTETEEAAVSAPFLSLCWQGAAFEVTDHCGQPVFAAQLHLPPPGWGEGGP